MRTNRKKSYYTLVLKNALWITLIHENFTKKLELKIENKHLLTSQKVATNPTPSSSASSSHKGSRVSTTRTKAAIKAVLLHVPTSVTSFKHGFSGAL